MECGIPIEQTPTVLGYDRRWIRQHIGTGMSDFGRSPQHNRAQDMQQRLITPGQHRHVNIAYFKIAHGRSDLSNMHRRYAGQSE